MLPHCPYRCTQSCDPKVPTHISRRFWCCFSVFLPLGAHPGHRKGGCALQTTSRYGINRDALDRSASTKLRGLFRLVQMLMDEWCEKRYTPAICTLSYSIVFQAIIQIADEQSKETIQGQQSGCLDGQRARHSTQLLYRAGNDA